MNRSGIVRIGILGAARIAPLALLAPAGEVAEARVEAIASKSRARGRRLAERFSIPRVYDDYSDLLNDRRIDAVYIPLPNSLHHQWALRALGAGKHVLCEKPIAANAHEAEEIADEARRHDLIAAEGIHFRHHPIAGTMKSILRSGELGQIRHIRARMCMLYPIPGDFRYQYSLAGGAMMDVGCYATNVVRFLVGSEPTVRAAEACCSSPQVDRWIQADLDFANGITARITCSLFSTDLGTSVTVVGSQGTMRVTNPFIPEPVPLITSPTGPYRAFRIAANRVRIRGSQRDRVFRLHAGASYTHQLRAFCNTILYGDPLATTAMEGAKTMRVIDAVYEKAGLRIRGDRQRLEHDKQVSATE